MAERMPGEGLPAATDAEDDGKRAARGATGDRSCGGTLPRTQYPARLADARPLTALVRRQSFRSARQGGGRVGATRPRHPTDFALGP